MAAVTNIATRRRVYIRPALPRRLTDPRHASKPSARSPIHRLNIVLVWLAIASSAVVFTEPAPTDLLTMAAIVLLPVVGLASFRASILVPGSALVTICGLGLVAAILASDASKSTIHMLISLYLSLAALVFAAFIARNPIDHTRLVFNACLFGALIAASAALIGYFDLIPGTKALFTKFDRASGPFKDPNVYGPFLILPIVYALHLWLSKSFLRGLPAALALAILSLALLFSFSRGAWAGAAAAVVIFLYLSFVTTRRDLDRLRIALLGLLGALGVLTAVIAALQVDTVANLFLQRASLDQSYDVGPEGRFGGQLKAIEILLQNPFGIGALEFTHTYHHEDTHNVYLSMFLNAGWLGGSLFVIITLMTLGLGFRQALLRTRAQRYFLVAISALVATSLLGLFVDTDHWRHLYLQLAVVWGLMAADKPAARENRIKADLRPVLLQPVIILPPTRRGPRIVGTTAQIVALRPRTPRRIGDFNRQPRLLRPIPPRRSPRLVAKDTPKVLPGPRANDILPPSWR